MAIITTLHKLIVIVNKTSKIIAGIKPNRIDVTNGIKRSKYRIFDYLTTPVVYKYVKLQQNSYLTYTLVQKYVGMCINNYFKYYVSLCEPKL